ncbi:MAG: Alanine--tRNA ligase [Calditrichaeota bacterium]|nr:Alanine--tRNA ligase [Calditrichota bacterium]
MTSAEIRTAFIEFFKQRGHTFVKSSPVVPADDPTLLFINAGMNQFKDVFLGTGARDYTRAVNSQKCIRVSGKHNDLEEVGPSPNHHTFFEMLGNWSFGDYYKPEAIRWAWELMTDVYGLPKQKLHATVFTEDDEAHRLWERETDIDPAHISRFGHADNFWEMGEVGPCGPCTELHLDLGEPAPGKPFIEDDAPNSESGRFVELWNLVFIQYHRDERGELHDLPAKHVDTGAGLERIARVLQGVESNYDTDLFAPIIEEIAERSGVAYEPAGIHIPHRVIADHLRSLSFAIADGALPGNEGRGYVLRRILRRASRFVRELGFDGPFVHTLVPALVETMGGHFTELRDRQQHIETVIRADEESFLRTLDKGLAVFGEVAGEGHISGADAFKLYDTYGFPLDLTQQMARERGIEVDVEGFQREMEKAKERSRAGAKFTNADAEFETVSEGPHSQFTGYFSHREATELRMTRRFDDGGETKYALVLAKTPFYAEAGGQVTDHGTISADDGRRFEVYDVQMEGDRRVHYARLVSSPDEDQPLTSDRGRDGVGGAPYPTGLEAVIDEDRRRRILPHHTTTHLLQAALREVLGTHVSQAGSSVQPNRMTFDYTHVKKPSPDQLARVERIVNENIRRDLPVTASYMSLEEAKAAGAIALFGEKYEDEVRVITIGDEHSGGVVSRELCGGTHLKRTGEAGLFRIESETGLSAGVRRVECTAGEVAYEKMNEERETLRRVVEAVGSAGSDPSLKIVKLFERQKELRREIERLQRAALKGSVDMLADWGEQIEFRGETVTAVFAHTDAVSDRNGLHQAGDRIIERLREAGREGFGVVGAQMEKTYMFVAVVTPGLIEKGLQAGKLVGAVAKRAGGGGGGKPDFATAGTKDIGAAKNLLADRRGFVGLVEQILQGWLL